MTITIDLEPQLQADLAREAATHGVAVDAYATRLIENAVRFPEGPRSEADVTQPSPRVIEAIETLKGFGKVHRLSLGGMSIRDLRDEARP